MSKKYFEKVYQKLKDAACQLKLMELDIPWSNEAKRVVKDPKKKTDYELLHSRTLNGFGMSV